MGGPVRNDLSSHRRDDSHYNQKKRDLKRHLPALKEYLEDKRKSGETGSLNFRILEDFSQNLSTSSIRVPMFVLLKGEEIFRREVLQKDKANQEALLIGCWRLPTFREGVVKKLEETVEKFGSVLRKDPRAMEEFIFQRSSSKEEYLESAARVIVFFQKNRVIDDDGGGRKRGMKCHECGGAASSSLEQGGEKQKEGGGNDNARGRRDLDEEEVQQQSSSKWTVSGSSNSSPITSSSSSPTDQNDEFNLGSSKSSPSGQGGGKEEEDVVAQCVK